MQAGRSVSGRASGFDFFFFESVNETGKTLYQNNLSKKDIQDDRTVPFAARSDGSVKEAS
ncbi:hypothetical protein BSF_28150 [Bacillus subtilis]|nr:hypothetical protein BSF_28150 [Bacillus subtilis]